jgi:hypothetical protein
LNAFQKNQIKNTGNKTKRELKRKKRGCTDNGHLLTKKQNKQEIKKQTDKTQTRSRTEGNREKRVGVEGGEKTVGVEHGGLEQ